MGFLNKIFNTASAVIIKPDFDFSNQINRSFDKDSDLITTVITAEKILAESLSKLPLEIYKVDSNKGKIKYKEHHLYRKLHNYPNSYSTSTSFFTALEKNRNHYGNSFAKINRNKVTGKIENFELIESKYIIAYKLHEGQLYFYYDNGEKQETINNNDLLHFKFLSEDGLFGMNPLKVLSYELENIFQGKVTLNNSYRNNLNIDKVIETSVSNFSTPQVQKSIDEVRKEYSGSINSKKTPFLPAGFKLVGAPTSSIQDSQILESLNFSKKDIASLYGVPTYMIFGEGTGGNIEQMGLNFKVSTIQYIAKIYRQELERKLLTEAELNEGISIEFNTDALVEVDLKTKTDTVIAQKKAGLMTPNEANIILGNKTFDNGDYHFVQMQDAVPLEKLDEFLPQLMAKNTGNNNPKKKKKEDEKDDK